MIKPHQLLFALCFVFLSGCGNSFASKGLLLNDSEWKVVVVSAKPVLVGVSMTMRFSQTGVSGSSGCNRYSTNYQADAESVKFSEAAVTKMWCVFPDGVMHQEDAFLKLLQEVESYSYDGARLILKRANGDEVLTLYRK